MTPNLSKKWLLQIAKDIEKSREVNSKGLPLLVEGRKDKELLLELGFSGPIEILNRGLSLEKLTTYLLEKYDSPNQNKEPIISILMDWDRTGDNLQKKLLHIFHSMDKKIDEKLRNDLIKTLNSRTKTVEGIRFILDELLELIGPIP
ncbi:MAG TPA: hypothetical protein QF644_02480 [Candidatus Poseidoniaceae archaeon]|jgi:5S rRNA maturation endonuclease (ribonuclease M5)|nr:hypothetical protein [Candidatus Poseidoniaceae archaeon]